MSEKVIIGIEELLPAMIELASIQHDLLQQLERPAPSIGPLSSGTPGRTGPSRAGSLADVFAGRPPLVDVEIRQLLMRSRELLSWLLFKAGSPP